MDHYFEFKIHTEDAVLPSEIAEAFAAFLRLHPFPYGRPDLVKVQSLGYCVPPEDPTRPTRGHAFL